MDLCVLDTHMYVHEGCWVDTSKEIDSSVGRTCTNTILFCIFSTSTPVFVFCYFSAPSSSPRHSNLAPPSTPPRRRRPGLPACTAQLLRKLPSLCLLRQPQHATATISRYGKNLEGRANKKINWVLAFPINFHVVDVDEDAVVGSWTATHVGAAHAQSPYHWPRPPWSPGSLATLPPVTRELILRARGPAGGRLKGVNAGEPLLPRRTRGGHGQSCAAWGNDSRWRQLLCMDVDGGGQMEVVSLPPREHRGVAACFVLLLLFDLCK